VNQEHIHEIKEFAGCGVAEGQRKEDFENQKKTENFLESESIEEDWPHWSGETIADSSERTNNSEETVVEVFFTYVLVVSVDE